MDHFYVLLERLEQRAGPLRMLAECTGRMAWPRRGIYFFFEQGEQRTDGARARVVRVGTHALRTGSRSTLWGRLKQHQGTGASGRRAGNHRASVFRLHVGHALLARGFHPEAQLTWGVGASAPAETRDREAGLEAAVSRVVGAMRVLWLDVPDDAGPNSIRGVVEANAIALLSNARGPGVDIPSPGWLGRWARSEQVRRSGLWNVQHVDAVHHPSFLSVMAEAVARTGRHVTAR